MITMLLALAMLQDLTKAEVLRLTKEGKPEVEILQAIGTSTFKLTADEVVELKKAGVSEAVLARMIAGPSAIAVENRAHKPLRIRLHEGVVEVGIGEELRPGQSIRLPGAGEFAVTVDGRPRSAKVRTPATLTFRGCDLEKFEVVTLFIEGPSGSDTCVVESRSKEAPEPPGDAPLPPPRSIGRGPLERTMDVLGGLPGRIFSGW